VPVEKLGVTCGHTVLAPKTGSSVSAMMLTQLFVLLSGFAFIYGVSSSFETYPIVGFSNEAQVGKNVLAALIGSDDKIFAFLISYTGDKPNEVPNPRKVILYQANKLGKWRREACPNLPKQAITARHVPAS
jgi:hypothetical protein